MTPSQPKTAFTSEPPTPRQFAACTPFGLQLQRGDPAPALCNQPAAHIRTSLRCGQIALLTGPSGSGKSRTLSMLADHLRRRGHVIVTPDHPPSNPNALLIDLLGVHLPPHRAMAHFSHFGLAEPALFARRLEELSEGQRHRALLARAFWHAEEVKARWVLIDEFCSVLDRVTAEGVAHTLARAAANTSLRVVCATAHQDLPHHLRPSVHLHFASTGEWAAQEVPPITAGSIVIEPGARDDMDRLLPHHYLAGRPATRVSFLHAFDHAHHQLAGVLVISMPTRNGIWRAQAWPGRYTGTDRKACVARLNAELRCISRVIVDPRYRGRGVARRLVEAYLRSPQTPATEAIAAMGSICPFFERSGMTAYDLPHDPRDARLADALEHEGREPWMLADVECSQQIARSPFLTRELARWARQRRVALTNPIELARLAAMRLCVKPRAYAHVFPPNTASHGRRGERNGVG